jgi:hypothetical protein
MQNLSPPRKVSQSVDYQRENAMPASRLQQQLQDLRDQLAEQPPLTEEERAELFVLTQEIELQLASQAVERFEASHPTLAGTLRNIVQSLANMGI